MPEAAHRHAALAHQFFLFHGGNQKAAIGTALDAEPPRYGDFASDQVACHGSKVVVNDLPLGSEPRLVPGRTEFSAATNVGEHENAAALKPEFAHGRIVARRFAHLEATVSVD